MAVVVLLLLSAACGAAENAGAVQRAVERGAAYLAARQSEDGAWRSGVHGVFRDGTALTPHVLRALAETACTPTGIESGVRWLAQAEPERMAYPTYAAAEAARLTSGEARSAWLACLRARQVTVPTAFPSTGGWAYPPGPMDAMVEANLSVTAYAVCALLASGTAPDDPAVVNAVAWLLDRFDPTRVPGDFLPEREPLRNANYFHFLEALTDAFTRARVPRERWAAPVARELLRRQAEDSSWRNDLAAGREDDPLVATPLAILALQRCR